MSKINALILNMDGTIKSVKIPHNLDINNLDISEIKICKKGLGDIKRYCDWKFDKFNLSLYGWKNGTAGNENKTELPPPEDSDLYFGSILIIKSNDNGLKNLKIEDYNDFIEKANGGFEDLGDEDTDTDDENNEYDLNDSFIDDSNVSEENYTSESEMSDRITDDSDMDE